MSEGRPGRGANLPPSEASMTPAARYERLFPLFDGAPRLEPGELVLARAPMRWMWTGWRDVARGGGGDCSNAALTAEALATVQLGESDVLVLDAPDLGHCFRFTAAELRRPPAATEEHALLRALLHATGAPPGLRLSVTARGIPAAAGLGTSAALAVALVLALAETAGRRLAPVDLIHAARLPETHLLGLSCGFQDQGAAVVGGIANHRTEFSAGEEAVVSRPLPVAEGFAETLSACLLVLDFGQPHSSHVAHLGVFERLEAGQPDSREAFRLLGEAEAGCQAAVAAGDLRAFAAALNLTWRAQGLLHPAMILPAMRAVVERLNGRGLLAANVNGAGMGGTMSLLLEPPAVGRAARELGETDGVRILPCALQPRGASCWRQRMG